jgi:hypothetical protein
MDDIAAYFNVWTERIYNTLLDTLYPFIRNELCQLIRFLPRIELCPHQPYQPQLQSEGDHSARDSDSPSPTASGGDRERAKAPTQLSAVWRDCSQARTKSR